MVAIGLRCSGDSRALRLSLVSLTAQTERPERVVLAVSALPGRPLSLPDPSEWPGLELRVHPAASTVDRHRLLLHDLRDATHAVLMSEGMIAAPRFLSTVRDTLQASPRALGALLVTHDRRDINRLGPAELAGDDPFGRLARPAMTGWSSLGVPRYFLPCALALVPSAFSRAAFERYAERSDWASFRLLLDQVGRLAGDEVATDLLAFIGARPDRRNAVDQGAAAVADLYRLADAHPRYRNQAGIDLGRLFVRHAALALRPTREGETARRFLSGMVAAWRTRGRLRKRLAADISHLA